ncbi:sodium-dependent transporter [Cardiobacteriaceae bacterium TAE3-ERU3]|nr:sodium-dependent transporter [Cardiobacteriaceae bacterium TAE3-ERU3]
MSINQQHSHAQWGSRMGFILAAVGSAVGLGNIWKFPYMVGQGGGSAFVFTYLICIAVVGFPILVAEWLIGRRGQSNPIAAMSSAAEDNLRPKAWAVFGVSGVLGAFLILSFYSVIGGWALNYIMQVGSGHFNGMNSEMVGNSFGAMLASPQELLTWHSAFMALTIIIVAMGVSGGLERAAKFLMPLLGICLLILVGYGFFSGGMGQAVDYLFTPNWGAIQKDTILSALGHAFFTLSLGMGIMMSYGSYLGREVNLLRTASVVIIMDTVIALIAGLAIFPIVFANGLPTNEGPGLIFTTLPIAFGNISGGLILGMLFFVLLTFAALTSAISLMEPVVEMLEEKTPLNRVAATIVGGLGTWALGIAALLSFNRWSEIKLFDLNIFDLLDTVTAKFMLPITGLGIIIFFGWFMRQQSIKDELQLRGFAWALWIFVVRFVAPIAVLAIFANQLGWLDWLWAMLDSSTATA